MSILWCGGEDIDFPNETIPAAGTFSFDTSMSRGTLRCPSGIAKSVLFTGITSGWLHFVGSVSGTYPSDLLAGLFQSASNKGILVSTSVTGSKIQLRKYDGSSYTLLASETGGSYVSGIRKVDLQISGIGSSSNAKVYVDSILFIDFTGDLSISGLTELNCVRIYGQYGSFGWNSNEFSQIIVADEDTRLMSLLTLAPSAAGDTSDWTNGYANIDEVTLSDTDTVYSETATQEFQCNLTGMPTGDFSVKAVKMAARMADAVGGFDAQIGLRTNSTTSLGADVGLTTSWAIYESLYLTNPVTSSAFTPAEIEALQLAFKSVTA